jgi:hypothetical protein
MHFNSLDGNLTLPYGAFPFLFNSFPKHVSYEYVVEFAQSLADLFDFLKINHQSPLPKLFLVHLSYSTIIFYSDIAESPKVPFILLKL